jgi:hypothetical protein
MTKKDAEKLWTIINKLDSLQQSIKGDYAKEEILKAKEILIAIPIKG